MTKKENNYILIWAKKIRAIRLLGGKCKRCGNEEWISLEFHHNSGEKEVEPRIAMRRRWSLVEKELKKCVLMCRNCHSELHGGSDTRAAIAKMLLLKAKNKFACEECGYSGANNGSLDFHHLRDKEFSPSDFTARRQVTLEAALVEIEKCSVLCANCHHKRHVDMDRFNKYKQLILERTISHSEYKLPLDPQITLKMFEQGMRVGEIAKKTGYPKSTVSTVLKKARIVKDSVAQKQSERLLIF